MLRDIYSCMRPIIQGFCVFTIVVYVLVSLYPFVKYRLVCRDDYTEVHNIILLYSIAINCVRREKTENIVRLSRIE